MCKCRRISPRQFEELKKAHPYQILKFAYDPWSDEESGVRLDLILLNSKYYVEYCRWSWLDGDYSEDDVACFCVVWECKTKKDAEALFSKLVKEHKLKVSPQ